LVKYYYSQDRGLQTLIYKIVPNLKEREDEMREAIEIQYGLKRAREGEGNFSHSKTVFLLIKLEP